MTFPTRSRSSSAPKADRSAHVSSSSPWRGCAACSGSPKPRLRTRCGTRSPRTFWHAAATCARSRSCSATPRCRPRRSIRRLIASNCYRFIAALIRAPNPLALPRDFVQSSLHQPSRETVMAGPHENLEHAEHAQHAAHEGGHNKQIALIISVLALFLAFSETFGKSAQTAALNFQIEASNLWNFFQAKNIRRTLTIVATEAAKV